MAPYNLASGTGTPLLRFVARSYIESCQKPTPKPMKQPTMSPMSARSSKRSGLVLEIHVLYNSQGRPALPSLQPRLVWKLSGIAVKKRKTVPQASASQMPKSSTTAQKKREIQLLLNRRFSTIVCALTHQVHEQASAKLSSYSL